MNRDSSTVEERHTKLIIDRYADNETTKVHSIAPETLATKYLSKVMNPEELRDKSVLELGAGCSAYVSLFLNSGCRQYYANDLIPNRLEAIRVSDPRYMELPGDFRTIEFPERVDIIFANLVMMFLEPMHDEIISKISSNLSIGGTVLTMDSNYICPLSIYRRFADLRANPARLFNPFAYARRFKRHGLKVIKLIPFTASFPSTDGNWILGTTFWLRAQKA